MKSLLRPSDRADYIKRIEAVLQAMQLTERRRPVKAGEQPRQQKERRCTRS